MLSLRSECVLLHVPLHTPASQLHRLSSQTPVRPLAHGQLHNGQLALLLSRHNKGVQQRTAHVPLSTGLADQSRRSCCVWRAWAPVHR